MPDCFVQPTPGFPSNKRQYSTISRCPPPNPIHAVSNSWGPRVDVKIPEGTRGSVRGGWGWGLSLTGNAINGKLRAPPVEVDTLWKHPNADGPWYRENKKERRNKRGQRRGGGMKKRVARKKGITNTNAVTNTAATDYSAATDYFRYIIGILSGPEVFLLIPNLYLY